MIDTAPAAVSSAIKAAARPTARKGEEQAVQEAHDAKKPLQWFMLTSDFLDAVRRRSVSWVATRVAFALMRVVKFKTRRTNPISYPTIAKAASTTRNGVCRALRVLESASFIRRMRGRRRADMSLEANRYFLAFMRKTMHETGEGEYRK